MKTRLKSPVVWLAVLAQICVCNDDIICNLKQLLYIT